MVEPFHAKLLAASFGEVLFMKVAGLFPLVSGFTDGGFDAEEFALPCRLCLERSGLRGLREGDHTVGRWDGDRCSA